jgi:vitamin B12 transporter
MKRVTVNDVVRRSVLAALVVGALGSSVVGAASTTSTTDSAYDLGNVVVTASRMAEQKVDVPADTTVITAGDIEKGNYTMVAQALQANNVQMVQNPFGSYPVLNGDTRVLVMVNGRKINWDELVVSGNDNAVDINQIPVANIARIEVVRGAASALYGERAVAGVINIITKTPEQGQSTTVDAQYGTWGKKRASITTQGGNDDFSYLLTYAKERRGDVFYTTKNGDTKRYDNTAINHDDLAGDFTKKIGTDRLDFDFYRNERKDGFNTAMTNNIAGTPYSTTDKIHQIISSSGLTYHFGDKNGNDTNTFIRVSNKHSSENASFAGSPDIHSLDDWTVDGQKQWNLDKHTVVAGFSWDRQSFEHTNGGATFNANQFTKALFVEDKWNFATDWNLNTGLRYEHHNLFGGSVTTHIGLNKKLDANSHVYLNWGQAVNTPTATQLYTNTMYMDGNPDLKQEKSNTWTLGADTKVNDRLSLSGSIFYSQLKDAILGGSFSDNTYDWGGYTFHKYMYINANKERRVGATLQATYKLNDAWRFNGGYTYTREEIDNGDGYSSYVNNTMPHGYNLGVAYSKGKWDAGAQLQYVTGRSLQVFTQKDYLTVDAYVSYWLTDSTKLYVNGYNLTNESYEVMPGTFYVGGYPMAARSFVVGVNHTF